MYQAERMWDAKLVAFWLIDSILFAN